MFTQKHDCAYDELLNHIYSELPSFAKCGETTQTQVLGAIRESTE